MSFPGIGGKLEIQTSRSVDPARVKCFDSPAGAPGVRSCDVIMAEVPFTLDRRNFGPDNKRNVDVVVPMSWSYLDRGRDCSIVVGTKDRAVVMTVWMNLWLAAAAINGMCVRQGRSGIYTDYGRQNFYSLRLLSFSVKVY